MSRVFVSGGAGFIGSHICDRIIEMGHEVLCYDSLVTGFKENIQHLREFSIFLRGRGYQRLGSSTESDGRVHACLSSSCSGFRSKVNRKSSPNKRDKLGRELECTFYFSCGWNQKICFCLKLFCIWG